MNIMKKEMNFFIHTKDVNYNDIIKPTSILDMFQDIAGLHAKDLGLGYEVLKSKGYAWVVLYQHYYVVNNPPYLDFVELETWPKPKHKLEFEREYLLKDKNNNDLIKGISNWVIIDLNTRGVVHSDKIDFDGNYYSFTNYQDKCKRKLNLDKSLIDEYKKYQVRLDDLDHNRHMNNTRYINCIENLFFNYEDKIYIKEIEIAYIKEAKYNDIINIGHYKMLDKDAYIGYINDNICFECLIGVEKI